MLIWSVIFFICFLSLWHPSILSCSLSGLPLAGLHLSFSLFCSLYPFSKLTDRIRNVCKKRCAHTRPGYSLHNIYRIYIYVFVYYHGSRCVYILLSMANKSYFLWPILDPFPLLLFGGRSLIHYIHQSIVGGGVIPSFVSRNGWDFCGTVNRSIFHISWRRLGPGPSYLASHAYFPFFFLVTTVGIIAPNFFFF